MATLITALGPVLGVAGYLLGSVWLFWLGFTICGFTLYMNLASQAMKFPVLPLVFMAFGSGLGRFFGSDLGRFSWTGAAGGLVAWTAVEAIGELVKLARQRAG